MALRQPFRILFLMSLMSALSACAPPGGAGPAPYSPPPTNTVLPTPGQCSNPLQPVKIGAKWTYSISGISSGTFTRTITDVRDDGFTDQTAFEGGTTTIHQWRCEAGSLTALSPAEGLSAMVQVEGLSLEFRTTAASGVTLPAIVRPADSWTQSFSLEGTQTIAGQPSQSKGEMSYSCTAGDTETVIVPAGTFDAVRVGCRINGTITVTAAGFELPTDFASATTIWYARDVGMVRTENEITNLGHSSIQLSGYTIP